MSSPSFPHQAVQLNHFEWTIQPVMAPAHNQVGPCQRMAIKQKIPALMLPETEVPEEIPDFRAIRLRENRAVLTVLPMKGSPNEIPVHRNDEELNRNRLRQLVVLGEKYYDQMYESRHGANGCYSSAKDAFYDAIGLANELGMKEHAEALSKRLDHIKAVFRSQFT